MADNKLELSFDFQELADQLSSEMIEEAREEITDKAIMLLDTIDSHLSEEQEKEVAAILEWAIHQALFRGALSSAESLRDTLGAMMSEQDRRQNEQENNC